MIIMPPQNSPLISNSTGASSHDPYLVKGVGRGQGFSFNLGHYMRSVCVKPPEKGPVTTTPPGGAVFVRVLFANLRTK